MEFQLQLLQSYDQIQWPYLQDCENMILVLKQIMLDNCWKTTNENDFFAVDQTEHLSDLVFYQLWS